MNDGQSDIELVKQYRKGEIDALSTLIERHRRGLFGYIYHCVQSQAEADDIYQGVWMRVIKKNKQFRGGNFGGWLTRIAHNLIVDRAHRRKPDLSIDYETPDGAALKNTLPAEAGAPGARIQEDDLRKRVACAVAQLPLEQREVFLMRTQQNLTFKEIANIHKTSINTALARMQYALSKLRAALADLKTELSPSNAERFEQLSSVPLDGHRSEIKT